MTRSVCRAIAVRRHSVQPTKIGITDQLENIKPFCPVLTVGKMKNPNAQTTFRSSSMPFTLMWIALSAVTREFR